MKKELFAFSPGDVVASFEFASIDTNQDDVSDFQDSDIVFVPLYRFVCEQYDDGASYGIFEIATAMYEDHIDIFNDIFKNDISFNIRIAPRLAVTKPVDIDPIGYYTECYIDKKVVSIPNNGIITTKYYFSNCDGFEEHILELPPIERDYSIDPLYRIARALENIKKLMDEKAEKKDDHEVVMTIEEFTKLMLDGKNPDDIK